MSNTHQVCLGHVLVIRRVVCCCFPKAIVTSGLWWLSMLSICSTLWSPTEEVDGFSDTALNVNFCSTKKNMTMLLVEVAIAPTKAFLSWTSF